MRFALVLIEKWVNDPSNVRILLIALDLWPEAELLEGVLSLLGPWTSSDMGPARRATRRLVLPVGVVPGRRYGNGP